MNNPKIDIKKQDLLILQEIFSNYPNAFLFGSRVKGTNKEYSDLDVCFIGEKELSDLEISLLKEKCENSNISFVVDIIDYHKISPSFRKIIDETKVSFPYLK